MTQDLLSVLPVRRGHFRLESGLHSDLWLTLDALFVSPRDLTELTATLAARLRPYGVSAVCGPLLGGAFLAQAVATQLGADFYFSKPTPTSVPPAVFEAEYRIPPQLQKRLVGQRVALVDDVISAGSSVRATARALTQAGALTVVVGTLLALGTLAIDYFARLGIPFESLSQREFATWSPEKCPLCNTGVALEDPS